MIPSTCYSLLSALNAESESGDAWMVFQRHYREVILAWSQRRGLNLQAAEDVTQEILLKLFQELPHHKHDATRGPFRSWLKTVVNNALTDYWRRQRRHPEAQAVGGSTFLDRIANLGDCDEDVEELSVALEDQAQTRAAEVIDRVRARVKQTSWQAFYETAMEGRSAANVAQELGITVGTVYKHKYRIKQLLEEEYKNVWATDSMAEPEHASPLPA